MLDNQICLVTGASRGLGRAIAHRLGEQGGFVIGTATSDSGAAAISEGLRQSGIDGVGLCLDVTDSDAVNEIVKRVKSDHGAPLVLVNNAGITRDNLLLRMKEQDWDTILDTDLKSVYRLSKACLPAMTKTRFGRIVNVTSVVGVSGNPGQVNYAAAKAGMIGFTKSLAAEVGSRNITVNAVAPGFIDTDMTRALEDSQKQELLAKIPLGRLGTADEVAHAVAFLAAPQSGYITGVTLHVNGGMYMT